MMRFEPMFLSVLRANAREARVLPPPVGTVSVKSPLAVCLSLYVIENVRPKFIDFGIRLSEDSHVLVECR